MALPTSVKVRMYRLGELGDCFLLTFSVGGSQSRMLIDCGSFRNSAASIKRLGEVVSDLGKNPLDLVVGTHQHNDHLSGFVHCEKEFRKLNIGQVWLSWLDDPKDPMALGIGKTHNNLKQALHSGSQQLRSRSLGEKGTRALEVLDDMLGFYGATKGSKLPPELPEKAVEILKTMGRGEPRYLRPGRVLDVPGVPAGSVRAYVLGPPRDSALLYRKDPRTGESYDHALASAAFTASRFLAALGNRPGRTAASEEQYPFNEHYKVRQGAGRTAALRKLQGGYDRPEEKWRRIDDDWTEQAESLALYLDSFTNNSSLVLAIELVASGKVLLFAADAQVGNWVSWADVKWEKPGMSTDDLLARTVLYKVGHHASHNATLVAALEKMTHVDLSALIPVDKSDPNITRLNGWRMPAHNLFKRLREKTSNRILQMDDQNVPGCELSTPAVRAAWERIGVKPNITPLFVEVEVGPGQIG